MKKLSLFWRIILNIAPIIVVAFFVFGIVLYTNQKKAIEDSTEERMKSQLQDLSNVLKVMIDEKQSKINSSLNIAKELFSNLGSITTEGKITVEAVNQITKETLQVEIDNWILDSVNLYKNYNFVDRIQELTSETATIFQKIPEGYLRISTNVKKNDGERAVGTFIPNDSPVIKAIEKGETYKGRAFVVSDWYLTAYEPIKINGEIKGILYVGVKEKNYTILKSVFDSKKYFASGYPFMIQDDGLFLIHPTNEGKNASENKFFNQLKESNGTGKSRYQWPENETGKWKWQYFTYFEPYKSYISVSIYEEDLLSNLETLKTIILASTIGAILLVILAVILLVKPITAQIKSALKKTEEIARGNLNVNFETTREDEIGNLFKALNSMTFTLRSIVSNIIDNANNLAEASEQLNEGALNLSKGNAEQASVSEEVSSSIEQMAANIQQTTENAHETHTISNTTSKNIKEGHESSAHSSVAMQQIAQKVQVINDIAFQTNILALNASVEAARAGQYGAGFSVVASEVGKLAAKSKEAAIQINALTEEGVQISEKAGLQLAKNVPEIERTTTLIKEIAEASNEQSIGTAQISLAIQQLNTSIQSNAATAEEISANAESLKSLAEDLKKSVNFFSI